MCQSIDKMHVFEQAGLGIAPFKCVGFSTTSTRASLNSYCRSHGLMYTTNLCGGTCDYCGTAIWNVFRIRSSDAKEFVVGCDCVLKTNDIGLRNIVGKITAEAAKARKQQSEQEKIAQLNDWVNDSEVRAKLTEIAHPKLRNLTMLNYVEWMIVHAGTTGKIKIWRLIDKHLNGSLINMKV